MAVQRVLVSRTKLEQIQYQCLTVLLTAGDDLEPVASKRCFQPLNHRV